jgi:2-oxoglutarate dehydrogenase E2 component (dihydrolipoamide succinyltransferase)
VAWHRKVGEAVRRDENLVDLETDKVVLEVPAPSNGVLKEIRVKDGATVTSGDILAVLEPGDGAAAGAQASAKSESAAGSQASASPQSAAAAAAPIRSSDAAGAPATAAPPEAATGDGNQRMGPAVRNLIEEHDLDPAAIEGSGREGRITKADILTYLDRNQETNVGLDESAPVVNNGGAGPSRREQRVTMTRLRSRIAERLVEAQQTAALLTTFNEIDMGAVMGLRKRYQEQFQKLYDVKLGFMSFFVRAAIEALKQYPVVNASIDGNEIVYHEFFDIGVAVSTERGLIVPVLRNAQAMGLADIEKKIVDYGQRARSGEIGMEDLTG